jgi:hypothetical protein
MDIQTHTGSSLFKSSLDQVRLPTLLRNAVRLSMFQMHSGLAGLNRKEPKLCLGVIGLFRQALK